MISETLVVFNHGIGGHRSKLIVTIGRGGPPTIIIHRNCATALDSACDYVRKTLGVEAPDPRFSWTLVQATPTDVAPTEVDGFSLFGAFAAALLQACVRKGIDNPDTMRGGSRALLSMIKSACL